MSRRLWVALVLGERMHNLGYKQMESDNQGAAY